MNGSDDAFDAGGPAATYDFAGEAVSTGVVDAVAAHRDTDPAELDPLYSVLDPDALETLVEDPGSASAQPVEVTFHYEDLEVTVDSDSTIYIDETD